MLKPASVSIALDGDASVKQQKQQQQQQQHQAKMDAPLAQPEMHPLLYYLLFCVGAVLYSSYTILVHMQEVNGKIPWSSSSMVLLTEMMKLCLSVGMYSPEVARKGSIELPAYRTALLYMVPAVLYTINNNLAVYIQLQMDPASYQILGNLKILTTALLFRMIIKRPISRIQWVSLLILFAAGVSNSIGSLSRDSRSASVLHVTPAGLIMICVYCTVSGLAGVYTEYVLKKQPSLSLHLQNSVLYAFCIALNALSFSYQAYHRPAKSYDLLQGFTWLTWILIFTQAVMGIIMGAIMKYASNISKLFLISFAMILTTAMSVLFFDLKLNAYFVASLICVIGAQYLYNR